MGNNKDEKLSSNLDDHQTQGGKGNVIGQHEEEIKLKPKMSLINGITVIVGSIIGSGIFVSPTGVLMYTGSVNMSLIVWVISGVFSMVCITVYNESLIFFYAIPNHNTCLIAVILQLLLYR